MAFKLWQMMLKIVMIFFQTHRRSAQLDNEHKFQFFEQSVPATEGR